MKTILGLLLALAAPAQTPPPAAAANASVSGVVRAQGSGDPIPDAEVSARASGRPVQTKTDSQGRYALRSLEPGSYTVYATVRPADGPGFGASAQRSIELQPGQELTGMDIRVRMPGQIAGRVLDQNGEPLPNMTVALVAREYSFGALRHVFASAGISDDQGRYTLSRVTPGRAFLVVAMKRQMQIPAISDAPDDPDLRRPAPLPTWYPNSPDAQGAEALTLRTAERRDGVDIRVRKARSFCIEANLSGPAGSSDLRFTIAPPRPHSGASGDGAMYMGQPGGKTGPDGKLRICDLPPGDYDLEAAQWPTGGLGGPDFLGVARVTISDRDVANVRVSALPKLTVLGEVVWDGPPPDKPLEAELSINLTSISRTIRPSAKSKIPGEFAFDDMVLDDYSMVFRGLSGSQYLKDVTYGGQSIKNRTLRPGAAPSGAGVRVIVAPDGAFLGATVKTADDQPAANVYVFVFPAVSTEADLAGSLVTGATNQNGSWKSPALAPGKYYVLAGDSPINKSPESIDKLMRSRTRAKEVTLTPNGTGAVTLEVKGIE
jgi:hypothetical protein